MKVVVTHHAKKRMLERIRCREDKVLKIAFKAWNSKDVPLNGYTKSDLCPRYKKENETFKYFLGRVFVFNHELKNVRVLVTVINI